MANIPPIKTLKVEDFPKEKDWIEKLLGPLNQFMESVASGLNKDLEFGPNVAAQIKTLEFETRSSALADTFPLYFKCTLKRKPQGVLVLSCVENDSVPAILTSPVWADWQLNDDGQIKIRHIAGLSTSQKYKVTFLVI